MGMMTQLIENITKEGIPGTVTKRYFHGNASPLKEFNTAEFARKGTGGMAQGWGAYITESEPVGKHYANITGQVQKIFLGKDDVNATIGGLDDGFPSVHKLLTEKKFDEARSVLDGIINHVEQVTETHPDKKFTDYLKSTSLPILRTSRDNVESLVPSNKFLHEVSIPEDMHFMDWDKPVGEETGKIIMNKFPGIHTMYDSTEQLSKTKGSQIYHDLESLVVSQDIYGQSEPSEKVSKILNSIGISGNKYKGDRSQGDYYNYVIFDDKKAKVVKSTMLATLMAALIGRDKVASPPRNDING